MNIILTPLEDKDIKNKEKSGIVKIHNGKRYKKDKICKNINKKINKINNSKIRVLSNYINNTISLLGFKNLILGSYYQILHGLFFCLIVFIFLFSDNIHHLIILLLLLAMDTFSIVVFHDCPLSLLEKKYLGLSTVENRIYHMKNSNIMYSTNKVYELTLDILINAWSLIAMKILILIFLEMFNLTPFFTHHQFTTKNI